MFLKNDLDEFFDNLTESNMSVPLKGVNIIDKQTNSRSNLSVRALPNMANTETSTINFAQMGGANRSFSPTSTYNANVVSRTNNTKDVNKLLSMLTTETDNGLTNTSTAVLEGQLRTMLTQAGGSDPTNPTNPTNPSNPSNPTNPSNPSNPVNTVRQFFAGLKQQGVNVNVQLDGLTMSEYFGGANTTTDVPQVYSPSSTSSFNVDAIFVNGQAGGAKVKKSSKSSKPKQNDEDSFTNINPGFQAFLNLKKHVAEKLGVSNGPIAAKVAGAVQKDMKEKHPKLDAVALAAEGIKYFNQNIEHYKQIIPKKN